MIYTIGTTELHTTSEEESVDKGSPNQVVGWRDMVETCYTLFAVCQNITFKKPPFIVDGISRAGWWGACFRNIWPDCKIHLNEAEKHCLDTLKRNFPKDKITSNSIKEWSPPTCDLAMIDFDFFTLKKAEKEWVDVLQRWAAAAKYLIIVDGACFGFKFGNLKSYNCSNEIEYYDLLNEFIKHNIPGKRITQISKFTNAATVVIEDVTKENKKDKIKHIPAFRNIQITKNKFKQPKPLF